VQHTSTITVESTLAPGVTYTLHRPNDVRRGILTRIIAEPVERLQRLLAEGRALVAGPPEGCDTARFDTVLSLISAETITLGAAHVLCFLESIQGLFIDGKIPAPADFTINAPDALRQECIAAIQTLLSATDTADEPQPSYPSTALLVN